MNDHRDGIADLLASRGIRGGVDNDLELEREREDGRDAVLAATRAVTEAPTVTLWEIERGVYEDRCTVMVVRGTEAQAQAVADRYNASDPQRNEDDAYRVAGEIDMIDMTATE